jgi:23S rRNA pseudouridine2605 synthase
MEERRHQKILKANKELAQTKPIDQFINVSNVDEFTKAERVSKRLSRMGICSRRVAEELIERGMIKVDGKIIKDNMKVTNENLLQVSSKTGVYTPVKENTRIWLFHKPMNMVTTHHDPQGRLTVFHRLRDLGLNIPHIISVGRLDFLSEGLLILTNDGDLSRALELPSYRLERSYRVRVFGRMFNEEKLKMIRSGMVMNGLKYRPYICEVEK